MKSEYILCVDDEAIILASLKQELQSEFGNEIQVATALNGEAALQLVAELEEEGATPALLVSDQRMPRMDGSELMEQVKRKHPDVITIMLTGYSDLDSIRHAVNDAGLYRLISKPWVATDLRMACRRAIEYRSQTQLNRNLLTQMEVLSRTISSIMEDLVDLSDPLTFRRVRKVSCFAALLAGEAGTDPAFRRKVFVFSNLHDIGKVTVPRRILAKNGPLDPDERTIVNSHVTLGSRLIRGIDVDPMVHDIIRHHHERWDGSGYPDGLKGKDIPLSARIVAIADVLDALLAERPYKKALSFDEADEVIRAGAGTQFDPALVAAFERAKDELQKVWEHDCIEPYLRKTGLMG
jgi:putative two-component system response regulator